jgi:hypothetical protein
MGPNVKIGVCRMQSPRAAMTAPLALSDAQIATVMTVARGLPRRLRDNYLRHIADLLRGRDFGDGDVHRACTAAFREIMQWPSAKAS